MRTIDPVRSAGLVTREIRTGSRDGKQTKIAVARRRYAAERPDVWDALTNAERIPRWFMPITVCAASDITVQALRAHRRRSRAS